MHMQAITATMPPIIAALPAPLTIVVALPTNCTGNDELDALGVPAVDTAVVFDIGAGDLDCIY